MRTPIVHLFVYGTLRPDGALHDWLEGSLLWSTPATANGRMHSVGAYPIVRFNEEGTVVGDVLTLRLNEDVLACISMEMHAGYELTEIDCTLHAGEVQESQVTAWAFHCADNTYKNKHVIEHGDWLQYEREHGAQWGKHGYVK